MRKSFKLLRMALAAIIMSVGFTACSSDHDGIEPVKPIDPNNTVSINGEEHVLNAAGGEPIYFYAHDYLSLWLQTTDGKEVYMNIDRSLINKTTNLAKINNNTVFTFDADDDDFNDADHEDWEYINNPSLKVKKGTLTVTEIQEGKEYEISLEYVVNSHYEDTFADRTVKLYYKGKIKADINNYVYRSTDYSIDINKVTYNAKTLKDENAYDITIETNKGNWNIQFDASNLGKVIDLSKIDPTPNPCRIQASDSFGYNGSEFIHCTHLGTFPNPEEPNIYFKVVKIKEGMFAIHIYYTTTYNFEISYIGDIKPV